MSYADDPRARVGRHRPAVPGDGSADRSAATGHPFGENA